MIPCFRLLFFIYGYSVSIPYCYDALFLDMRLVYMVNNSFIWLYCLHALYAKIKRCKSIDK